MPNLDVRLIYGIEDLRRFAGEDNSRLWIYRTELDLVTAELIAPLLKSSSSSSIVLCGPSAQSATSIATLFASAKDMRFISTEVNAHIHGNLFVGMRADGTAWSASGVTQLRTASLQRPMEVLTGVQGSTEHPYFADLITWISELASFGQRVISSRISDICLPYSAGRSTTPRTDLTGGKPRDRGFPITVIERFGPAQLLSYIQKLKTFASYKLVILDLLAHHGGRMTLSECARKFHAFYLELARMDQMPERPTGNPPPLMLHPREYSLPEIESLLLDEPKKAFHHDGDLVVFQAGVAGVEIAIVPSLWAATTPELRKVIHEALLERLNEYYLRYTGACQDVGHAMETAHHS